MVQAHEKADEAETRQGGNMSTERIASMGFVFFLGAAYCMNSAGLIAYNKFLMHKDRFPFAVPLVLLHTVFSSLFAGLLFLIRPSLFPSLTDPARKVAVDSSLIGKGALPIAVFFAGQLVLGNTAYLHSSVAFLQMMKEANILLVYILSLMFALERFNWRSCRLLAFVVLATTLTIHGELHFSFTGFAIQGASQCFECMRIVLQAMLLSNAGRKLDALTYVLLVMPICFMILLTLLCSLIWVWPNDHLAVPAWSDVARWWPHLVLNAMVAFMLNVVIAFFVKHSSAVFFILAGIVKDAAIVCAGALMLREAVSRMQAFGFTLQLGGILVYTMVKSFPDKFEGGLLQGMGEVLFGFTYGGSAMQKKGLDIREKEDYGALEGGSTKKAG